MGMDSSGRRRVSFASCIIVQVFLFLDCSSLQSATKHGSLTPRTSTTRFPHVATTGTSLAHSRDNGILAFAQSRLLLRRQSKGYCVGGTARLICSMQQTPREEHADVDAGKVRRKPRGRNLKRDDAGVPIEKVYAPRQRLYPTKVGGSGFTRRVRPQGEEREVSINNAARLRVAGGSVKGRRLESPDVFLRPMMGKVKEALFNTLLGFGVFETGDARFLDLFSGSGSVGIEALSRGAGFVTFVDFAKDCCEVCMRNAHLCGFGEQANAVRADVLDVLYNPLKYGLDKPYDVITVTPPYEEVVYAELIEALAASKLVARDTIVVIEYPVELGCLPHAIGDGTMVGLRNRRYGRTVLGVWVYLPTGQLDDLLDSRPEEFVTLK